MKSVKNEIIAVYDPIYDFVHVSVSNSVWTSVVKIKDIHEIIWGQVGVSTITYLQMHIH